MTPDLFRSITDQITPDAVYFLPEIALALTACTVLLLDLVLRRSDSRQLGWVALVGVAASAALLLGLNPWEDPRALFRAAALDEGGARTGEMGPTGMIWWDGFGNAFKLLILIGTGASIALTYLSRQMDGVRHGEFLAVLLTAVVGAFLMATASDMLIFVLGIEMVSIPSYILVCYTKKSKASSEAALKYVVYGSVASGMMIYGFSLMYGMTGTTQLGALSGIAAAEVQNGMDLTFAFVLLLTLAGFAYKMSMVPFHFWTPDVYEGAPTPVTAFLATVSKLAGFAVFIRLLQPLYGAPGIEGFDWATMVCVFAGITMTVGNLGALLQTDIKRMLAYSSIAHAGYLLMGCVVLFSSVYNDYTGTHAVAFYAIVYLFMNFGAFAVLIAVENATGRGDLEAFRGLYKRAPMLCGCMVVFMVGLVGLPPTGGFTGKFGLFMVAVSAEAYWLVVIAAVNTAISLVYYARVMRQMYLVDAADITSEPLGESGLLRALVVGCAAVTLWLGVFFGGTLERVERMTFANDGPVASEVAPPNAGASLGRER